MSRRRLRRYLRHVTSVLALTVMIAAALAMFSAPAHAASCDGSNSLVSLGTNCASLAGVSVTTGPTTCVSGTACATPQQPDPNDPGAITKTVTPPPAPPAKPPAVHKTTPKRAPVRPASMPIRIHEADTDPAWFTSGSYEPMLPYHLPSYLRPFRGAEPPAHSSARIVDLRGLSVPLRLGLIYAGLGLLAAAVGVRRMLVAR